MTDNFLNELTDDLKPVKTLRHPIVGALVTSSIVLFYLSVVVSLLGVRADISDKLGEATYIYEILMAFILGILGIVSTSFSRFPDNYGCGWIQAVPFTLVSALIIWLAVKTSTHGLHLEPFHWDDCFTDALFLGFIPAAALVALVKSGTSTKPCLSMATIVVSVSALGWGALRLTCPLDTIEHSVFYHLAPFIIVGSVLGALARRLLKW